MKYDVLVIGAGVIGNALAYVFARQGARVGLIDAGEPGGQASNAAAGILSPSAESEPFTPMLTLMQESLNRYPRFVQEVEEASGMRVDFETRGVLRIAANEDDAQSLALQGQSFRACGLGAQWLDEKAAAEVEPFVAGRVRGGLFTAEEGQIHAPRFVQALFRAAQVYGAVPHLGEPVIALEKDGTGRFIGVKTAKTRIKAAKLVLATGAWASHLLKEHGLDLPVRPVRGQVLALRPDRRIVRTILFSGSHYMVPKADGRLIIGATEDEAGFDARVTAGGFVRLAAILDQFHLPGNDVYLDRMWAGLRPATVDGLPVLGSWPQHPELFVAGGHYRNGILLTPVTAAIARAWWDEAPSPVKLAPFRPDRF